MREYLSWPADGLDPYRLGAQAQVIRVVAMVAGKVGLEARRRRESERVLRALEARTFGADDGAQDGYGETWALGTGVARNCGPPRKLRAIFRIIAARMVEPP